jgi:hypothetical protein
MRLVAVHPNATCAVPAGAPDELIHGADVVVVGAGFSKAICESLPTTDERERCVSDSLLRTRDDCRRLHLQTGGLKNGLALLSSRTSAPHPPGGCVDQSYEAMALRYRVTNALHDVVSAPNSTINN